MKKMIVTAVTLTMMVVMIESAKAQSSADKGLATIDSNVENSAANLASYKKNLAVVEENIAEIGKARQQVKGQGDEVKKHLQDNKKSRHPRGTRQRAANIDW